MAAAHGNLGAVLRQAGALQPAAEAFRQALALEPGNGHFRGQLDDVVRRLEAAGPVAA